LPHLIRLKGRADGLHDGPGSLQAIQPVVNVLSFNLALDALRPA